MEERFVFRSGFTIFVMMLAVCFEPSEQTPLCLSPTDCDGDGFSYRADHHRLNPKYISRVENLNGVKELMETLLMQHNERGYFTERPPINEGSLIENTSVKTTTQRPPIVVRLGDILSQFPKIRKSTKKTDKLDVTTVEPQQLINRLTTHEYHLEMTTTAQPQPPIQLLNTSEQLDVTTPAPNNTTKWENIKSHLVNVPPTKPNKKKTKRTTTKGPHTILHPQQLDTLNDGTPNSGNLMEKITRKPTTQPTEQISSLMPLDQVQDVKGEIQLETLNRPIITTTTATPVRGAASSSSKPKRKPINIIPQPVAGVRPSSPVPGSTGIRNPIRNSTPPSEPENYLISALASIADGDEDSDGEEIDEDEEEEDEEYEEDEENSDENENEEDYEDEEEEDEYPINSAEATPERENFDSVDASDIISSVIEEVGALI